MRTRAYGYSSDDGMMRTAWWTMAGGMVGMCLGYLIANHLMGFDPLNVLPITVVIGR
jgi:hypothetical protein